MVRELQFARRQAQVEATAPDSVLPWTGRPAKEMVSGSSCQHRTVAKDGRIVCARVVEGENEVSPNVCRDCPFKAVNCSHLRFSLRRTSPSPLIVRYNGRTEIWDDGPSELCFERAACAAKVIPIYEPRSCAGCTLHKPIQVPVEAPNRSQMPVAATAGKVVAFPSHEPVAAAG
jgi:hypothetical protein